MLTNIMLKVQNMKTIEILSVGLRLVGIYGILKGIQSLAMAYGSLPMYQSQFPDDNSYYFVAGGFVLVYFIAAIILIIFPVRLARLLTPRTEEPSVEVVHNAKGFQAAALSILGVYVVAYSLPMVFQHSVLAWQAFAMPEFYNDTAGLEHLVYTVSRAIELSIGLYLFLQSRALVNLVYKLRGLGAK